MKADQRRGDGEQVEVGLPPMLQLDVDGAAQGSGGGEELGGPAPGPEQGRGARRRSAIAHQPRATCQMADNLAAGHGSVEPHQVGQGFGVRGELGEAVGEARGGREVVLQDQGDRPAGGDDALRRGDMA